MDLNVRLNEIEELKNQENIFFGSLSDEELVEYMTIVYKKNKELLKSKDYKIIKGCNVNGRKKRI